MQMPAGGPALPDARVSENLERIFRARSAAQLESRARESAANQAMSDGALRQLTKAGIATDELEAAGAMNLAAMREGIAAYRDAEGKRWQRQHDQRGHTSALEPKLRPGAPAGATFTPPYLITHVDVSPPGIPGADGFVNATPGGELNYFIEAMKEAPANVTVNALQGILLWPVVEGHLSTVPGFATVGATSSVFMVGHAGCAFFGGARADGSLGFLIMEWDQHANFVREMVAPSGLGFDISVNWGQTQLPPPISASSFSQGFSFFTEPNMFYTVHVSLWGGVATNGDSGLSGSWASIFADVFVHSISFAWFSLP